MTFSNWRLVTLALAVGCVAPPVATSVEAQTYQCADSSNAQAYQLETYVVEVVTGTDSVSLQSRAMYQLPSTTASKVSYVTSSTTCHTAATNYYAAIGSPAPTSGTIVVTVVKVGTTRYVVQVIGEQAGEFNLTVVFDSKWARLANIIN